MNFFKKNWFQLFKYSVYIAVFANVFMFFKKEIVSSAHRFGSIDSVASFLEAFTSTIDTGAWVILLFLFELETYVIDDDKLQGALQWLFLTIRGLCYLVIFSSFLGYCSNFTWLQNFQTTDLTTLCDVKGQSWMEELDDFTNITGKNCGSLAESSSFLKYKGKEIYTDSHFYKETIWLAVIDILNSLSWILIVIILEIDVWLQLRGKFTGTLFSASKYFKNALYAFLLFAAIYWGIFGDFLEFWDAFLWIIAFFFIEMNIIEWQKEIEENDTKSA